MNLYKKSALAILIVLAISIASCKKYLEKKSDTSLAVPTTLNDFQALMDRSGVMNLSTPSSGDASSDDYFWTNATYLSAGDLVKKTYVWIPGDYNYPNDWANGYRSIYISNLCLDGLMNINITNENSNQWQIVKGAAMFYRAYHFLNLVWIYSKAYDASTADQDLGIALRLTPDPDIPTSRASVKNCYDQIVSDAKEAVRLLPDLPENTYRPSKAAAYGLLARTYLSMRLYDQALLYSDSCLRLQNYLMNYNGDPGINNLSQTSTVSFKNYKLNGEIVFYSEENLVSLLYNTHQFSLGKVDTSITTSYGNGDLRKTGFLYPYQGYYAFKGNYTGSRTLYFTGIATDEMYLIRAECYARAGDKDKALSDLNFLLQKRWLNNGSWVAITATDATDALNKILIERRKELLYRGLRWIDIKRLNKEGRNIILKRVLPDGSQVLLQPNANYYALPLPKDIIDLTGIPQNPY